MPPRFAYWTIIVDNQPTAFRAKEADELLPTLNRLKEKHPSAVMMWFQSGQLWGSRAEAQQAFVTARREEAQKKRAAGEPPRDRKWRPGGEHKDPRQKYKDARKAKWTRYKERVRAGERPRPPGKAARPYGTDNRRTGDDAPLHAKPPSRGGDRRPYGKDSRPPSGNRPPFGKSSRPPGSNRAPYRDDRRPPGGAGRPPGRTTRPPGPRRRKEDKE